MKISHGATGDDSRGLQLLVRDDNSPIKSLWTHSDAVVEVFRRRADAEDAGLEHGLHESDHVHVGGGRASDCPRRAVAVCVLGQIRRLELLTKTRNLFDSLSKSGARVGVFPILFPGAATFVQETFVQERPSYRRAAVRVHTKTFVQESGGAEQGSESQI